MIEIREVKTKKEQKQFVEFPLNLYKGNPYFVPPLYGDEMKMFKKDFIYHESCDIVNYLAFEDGKVVGRIQGIIQRDANKKNNEKRVRFSRFDALDRQEIADALFGAVEKWAKGKGMDTACGPRLRPNMHSARKGPRMWWRQGAPCGRKMWPERPWKKTRSPRCSFLRSLMSLPRRDCGMLPPGRL